MVGPQLPPRDELEPKPADRAHLTAPPKCWVLARLGLPRRGEPEPTAKLVSRPGVGIGAQLGQQRVSPRDSELHDPQVATPQGSSRRVIVYGGHFSPINPAPWKVASPISGQYLGIALFTNDSLRLSRPRYWASGSRLIFLGAGPFPFGGCVCANQAKPRESLDSLL